MWICRRPQFIVTWNGGSPLKRTKKKRFIKILCRLNLIPFGSIVRTICFNIQGGFLEGIHQNFGPTKTTYIRLRFTMNCIFYRKKAVHFKTFLTVTFQFVLFCFRFCGLISDTAMFTAFCFLLRATLAIGGSASEVAALSILIGKFPNNVGAITVRYLCYDSGTISSFGKALVWITWGRGFYLIILWTKMLPDTCKTFACLGWQIPQSAAGNKANVLDRNTPFKHGNKRAFFSQTFAK